MTAVKKALLLCLMLTPLAAFSAESELERFEKDATIEREARKPDTRSRRPPAENSSDAADSSEQDLNEELVSMVVEIAFDIVTYPGIYSWQRVTPSTSGETTEEYPVIPRALGEGMIPFARIDVSYNRITSQIHATSERAEIGYGPFGFEARRAHYSESEPDASLDVMQYHFLYRMSLGDNVELDLGMGRYELSGVSSSSGGSSTVHILVYPTERFGMEYRPSWANINGNGIRDHELAISYGDKFWSARAGYHWLESPGSSLNGPFAGFSFRF